MDAILASTYHDADARLVYMFEDYVPKLRELYVGIGVVAPPLTRESAGRRLVELGIDVHGTRENGSGCAYRRALEAALSSEGERVHYCGWERHF